MKYDRFLIKREKWYFCARKENRLHDVPLNDYSTQEQKVVFLTLISIWPLLLRYPGWLCVVFISILILSQKQPARLLYRYKYSYTYTDPYIRRCTKLTLLEEVGHIMFRSQQMNCWQKFSLDWVALLYKCVCANNCV